LILFYFIFFVKFRQRIRDEGQTYQECYYLVRF